MTTATTVLEIFIGGLVLVNHPEQAKPEVWIPAGDGMHHATLQWADAWAYCEEGTCPVHEVGDRGLVVLEAGDQIVIDLQSQSQLPPKRQPSKDPKPGPGEPGTWDHVLPASWIVPEGAKLKPDLSQSIRITLPYGEFASRGFPERGAGLAKWTSSKDATQAVADEVVVETSLPTEGIRIRQVGEGGARWVIRLDAAAAGPTPALRIRNLMFENPTSDHDQNQLEHNRHLCPLFVDSAGSRLCAGACNTPIASNPGELRYRQSPFPKQPGIIEPRTKTTGFCPPAGSP